MHALKHDSLFILDPQESTGIGSVGHKDFIHAKGISASMSDSGYVSTASNTPMTDRTDINRDQRAAPTASAAPTVILMFKRDIPQTVLDHFENVRAQLLISLPQEITRSSKGTQQSACMRLAWLGTTARMLSYVSWYAVPIQRKKWSRSSSRESSRSRLVRLSTHQSRGLRSSSMPVH